MDVISDTDSGCRHNKFLVAKDSSKDVSCSKADDTGTS